LHSILAHAYHLFDLLVCKPGAKSKLYLLNLSNYCVTVDNTGQPTV